MARLVSQLRFKAKPIKPVRNIEGFAGSLRIIQKNVSALITHERIETTENKAFLTRQYTEKLIGDALLHGDKHKHTMEMATWWLDDVSFTHLYNLESPKCRDLVSMGVVGAAAPADF